MLERVAMADDGEILFFASPAAWRRWLARHHAKATEVWVGLYETKRGKPSITWPESVDEALCYGWIDGLRKSIDETAYKIRFTPRKATSIWSSVNVRRVAELEKQGRMEPAGRAAFAKRKADRSGVYSFERKEEAKLDPAMLRRFEKNAKAWAWFQAQAPRYRRTALHWVVSAKKEETRERRFEALVADSAGGRTIGPLTRPTGRVSGGKAKRTLSAV